MALSGERAAARGKTKLRVGSLLVAVGFVGALTLAFDFQSWKTDGYITNLVFCLALIGCGASLFVADRAGYHLGWMTLVGGMLIAVMCVELAAECEAYLLANSIDLTRSLFLVLALGYFGSLFLHLGHRRNLARARG